MQMYDTEMGKGRNLPDVWLDQKQRKTALALYFLKFNRSLGWRLGISSPSIHLAEPGDKGDRPLRAILLRSTQTKAVTALLVEMDFRRHTDTLEGLVEDLAVCGHDALVVFGMDEKHGGRIGSNQFFR